MSALSAALNNVRLKKVEKVNDSSQTLQKGAMYMHEMRVLIDRPEHTGFAETEEDVTKYQNDVLDLNIENWYAHPLTPTPRTHITYTKYKTHNGHSYSFRKGYVLAHALHATDF